MKFLEARVKALDPGDAVGSFEAVASAPTLDRDNEIIDVGAFDPLPPSVPVHLDHILSVENVVARGVPFYDRDRLKIQGVFASTPRAQEIRTLIADGVVDTVSVGMIGVRRAMKDGIQHITRAELIEVSFVSVPSNRDARVLVAREMNAGTAVARAYKVTTEAMIALAELDLAELDRTEHFKTPTPGWRDSVRRAEAALEALERRIR